MDISVIMPVYRVERYVKRCLESVINQTYKGEVECIIINDCSPDRSLEIIENVLSTYQGKINFKILHHPKNLGSAQARNTGLKAAKGEYLIQVDSDDYFEEDMLLKMYNKAKLENADIVIADYYLSFSDKEEYQRQILPSNKEDIFRRLIWCPYRNNFTRGMWNKLIKRSLYFDNDIYCYPNINYGEDLLVMLRIFGVAKKIEKIDEAFYHYVQYNISSYCSAINYGNMMNRIDAIKIIDDFISEKQIECNKAFAFEKLSSKSYILFGTSGKLQCQYTSLYKEVDEYISPFLSETNHSLYWKLAYRFGLRGNLFVFNLMRGFWRLLRNRSERLVNEDDIIEYVRSN